jgi:hypothetical protein
LRSAVSRECVCSGSRWSRTFASKTSARANLSASGHS